MTRKSDGEKIDELEQSATRLTERLDNTINSLDDLSTDHENLEVIVHDLRREVERELALSKRELDELKK